MEISFHSERVFQCEREKVFHARQKMSRAQQQNCDVGHCMNIPLSLCMYKWRLLELFIIGNSYLTTQNDLIAILSYSMWIHLIESFCR